MNYRIIVLFISFLLFGCETTQKTKINVLYLNNNDVKKILSIKVSNFLK